MQHAIANVTFFDAVHLIVNVALPEQNRANNVAISGLDEIADGERPFAHLAALKLQLVSEVDNDRLKRVLHWNLEADLDRHLRVLIVSRNNLLRLLIEHECELVLLAKLCLS